MPTLNFQKQFAPLVESGKKRQTIRAYRKDGRDPKVGNTLYLYTGQRTKACRKLGEAKCKSAVPFRIWWGFHQWVVMRTEDYALRRLSGESANRLAVANGFEDWADMVRWFEKTHGLPFEGLLIRWNEVTPPEGAE